MPTLGELLNPETMQALKEVKIANVHNHAWNSGPFPTSCACGMRILDGRVVKTDPKLLRECMCGKGLRDGFVTVDEVIVHKGCGSPRKTISTVRGANVQSLTMPCSGCGVKVTIAKRERQLEQVLAEQRVVACRECAEAMTRGKTGSIVVKAPSKGGSPQAVLSTTAKRKEQAVPKVSIDEIPDAELGAMVKREMRAAIEAEVPERASEAKKVKAAKEGDESKAKKAQSADLTDIGVLPGFTIKHVTVPDLDVSAIESLDEIVPAKQRSPYNKARNVFGESPLPSGKEPGIGVETTTWADLITEHQRLTEKGASPVEKGKKKAKVAAHVDLDERVQVLCRTFGVDEPTARQMMADVGV